MLASTIILYFATASCFWAARLGLELTRRWDGLSLLSFRFPVRQIIYESAGKHDAWVDDREIRF